MKEIIAGARPANADTRGAVIALCEHAVPRGSSWNRGAACRRSSPTSKFLRSPPAPRLHGELLLQVNVTVLWTQDQRRGDAERAPGTCATLRLPGRSPCAAPSPPFTIPSLSKSPMASCSARKPRSMSGVTRTVGAFRRGAASASVLGRGEDSLSKSKSRRNRRASLPDNTLSARRRARRRFMADKGTGSARAT